MQVTLKYSEADILRYDNPDFIIKSRPQLVLQHR